MYASDINNLTFFPIGTILQFSGGEYTRLTSARTADNKVIWTLCNGTAVNGITVPNLVDKFLRGAASSGTTAGADSRSVSITTANLPSHSHGATGLSLGGLSTSDLSVTGGGHGHTGSGLTNTGSGGHKHSDISGTTSTSSLTGSFIEDRNTWVGAGIVTKGGDVSGGSAAGSGGGAQLNIDASHGHSFSGAYTGENSGTHSHNVSVTISESGSHTHTISGSISGGNITGSTANAGSGTALTIDTLPSYYTVVYIMKVA
jgi:hypothetical protein